MTTAVADADPQRTLWAAASSDDLAAFRRALGEIPALDLNRMGPGPRESGYCGSAAVGKTLLMLAVGRGSLAVARELLGMGADADARDAQEATALHHAARSGPDASVIELLAAAGADVNAPDSEGRTPLMAVYDAGTDPEESLALEKVKALTGVGADVRAWDGRGATALHAPCRRGHVLVAAWLFRCGADPHARIKVGQSPAEMLDQYRRGRWKDPAPHILYATFTERSESVAVNAA